MARIRTIKPEFPQSASMGRVSRDARLLFVLLWTLVDDEGRTRGDSRMLASLLFPYDDGEEGHIKTSRTDVDGWLSELEREHCVIRYENGGNQYIQVCNWLNHQKIDKATRSKLPSHDAPESRSLPSIREASSEEGKGKEGKGEEKRVASGKPAAPQAELIDPPDADDGEPRKGRTNATWEAYSAAYRGRYGADPVRNKTVNSQLAAFIARVGISEAPEIAAFFVRHPSAFYAQRGHAVGQLLADAEKLRTEWATQRVTTATTARQQERTASNVFARLAADQEDADAQA